MRRLPTAAQMASLCVLCVGPHMLAYLRLRRGIDMMVYIGWMTSGMSAARRALSFGAFAFVNWRPHRFCLRHCLIHKAKQQVKHGANKLLFSGSSGTRSRAVKLKLSMIIAARVVRLGSWEVLGRMPKQRIFDRSAARIMGRTRAKTYCVCVQTTMCCWITGVLR